MRFFRSLVGVALRAAGAITALWGVVLLFDGRPVLGVAAILGALGLTVAGSWLQAHPGRADLSNALYISGDDMIGYRSHILRRHGR
jgi:hypothetical protein